MRILIFFTLLIIGSFNIYGQKRTITGIMVDEYLVPVADAKIINSDSLFLGLTDLNGKFTIDISPERNWVLIGAIAYEWKSITIPIACNHLEVILMGQVHYDFIPLQKVNRLRKKRFKKLPKLHKAAYEKSIFLSKRICYEDKFIPFSR